jgi:phosphatidylserine/phosphatidylglycerophosphate/cardiolipin synthase-like enzyme
VDVLGRGAVGGLLAHGSLFLVDRRLAVIGSVALTTPSLDTRRELAIVSAESSVVQPLDRLFDDLLQQDVAPADMPEMEDDDDED